MESSRLIDALAESRKRFYSFIRARVDGDESAEDILQTALLKATEGVNTLRDEESVVPWFYTILRNGIADSHRRRARLSETSLPQDFDTEDDYSEERQICECFRPLVGALKPEYRDLITALDLDQESPEHVSQRLGITPNNLKVRHHRARRDLRRRLEETCRVCAEHHCFDCTCGA